jgi:hypothetical protein
MAFKTNPAYGFVRIVETGHLVAFDGAREFEAFVALCQLWKIRHEIVTRFLAYTTR